MINSVTEVEKVNIITREDSKRSELIKFILSEETKNKKITEKQIRTITQNFHGINLQFNVYDEKLIDLYDQCFPYKDEISNTDGQRKYEKEACVTVDWYSTEQLGWSWDGNGDHHCHINLYDNKRIVVQRDFVCFHKSEKHIILITKSDLDDGPFNFLRYISPHLLMKEDKFIIHSACVLNSEKKATLFLGHSGFGKSTISSMFSKERVLGDDMNVVSVKEDGLFIEPATLGQGITNWDLQGEQFPIESIYWLKKSKENSVNIEKIDKTKQRLKMFGSLSGVFWDHLTEEQVKSVFQFVEKSIRYNPIQEFSFSLNSEVKNYV